MFENTPPLRAAVPAPPFPPSLIHPVPYLSGFRAIMSHIGVNVPVCPP